MTADLFLEITMSARAVVAVGQPFAPRPDRFSDAGVAFDEICDLHAGAEPLVLRVTAAGAARAEAASIVGDWFCDSDGSVPRWINEPRWHHSSESRNWTRTRTLLDALLRCEDARWMLHAAAIIGVERRLVVRAACACARTSLRFADPADTRPRQAIEAAERWARGEEILWHVREAEEAAAEAGNNADSDVYIAASSAAVHAARTARLDPGSYDSGQHTRSASYANAASFAASHANYAAVLSDAAGADRTEALRKMAALVRENIPAVAVLRAGSVAPT